MTELIGTERGHLPVSGVVLSLQGDAVLLRTTVGSRLVRPLDDAAAGFTAEVPLGWAGLLAWSVVIGRGRPLDSVTFRPVASLRWSRSVTAIPQPLGPVHWVGAVAASYAVADLMLDDAVLNTCHLDALARL